MAKVEKSGSGIKIEIADPVELERLVSVLARSKSRKNASLLKKIKAAVGELVADEVVTPEVVDDVVAKFEKLLEG